jgi:hypothetical protein
MSDDVANLKAELQILSGRIQAERNDEVRHGLQRGRLETERAQLMVKMIEAMAIAPTIAPAAIAPAVAPAAARADYNVVLMSCPAGKAAPGPYKPWYPAVVPDVAATPIAAKAPPAPTRSTPKKKWTPKPSGLPKTENLIFAVLENAGWLRPNQIVARIRERFWKDAHSACVSPLVWRMGRDGKLEKSGDGYRLPGGAATVAEPLETQRRANGQFGA